MEVLKVATKTLQLAIQTVVNATKAVVDATKIKVDDIDTRTTIIKTNVDTINTNVGELMNGRVVKSVQRGLFQMSSGTQGVTISAVNLSKCQITFNGFFTATGTSYVPSYQVYLGAVTSTQLSFICMYLPNNTYINWQVVEFY